MGCVSGRGLFGDPPVVTECGVQGSRPAPHSPLVLRADLGRGCAGQEGGGLLECASVGAAGGRTVSLLVWGFAFIMGTSLMGPPRLRQWSAVVKNLSWS